MTDMGGWLTSIAIGLAVWIYAHRRLWVAAQGLRLEMADRGERLLAENALPERAVSNVEFMLDTACGGGWFLLAGIFLLPGISIGLIRGSGDTTEEQLSVPVRAELAEVRQLHDRIMFANHPISWIGFQLTIFLALVIVIVGRALLRGDMPATGRFQILSGIESNEYRRSHFRWRPAH